MEEEIVARHNGALAGEETAMRAEMTESMEAPVAPRIDRLAI